jgi:hypothetical protein
VEGAELRDAETVLAQLGGWFGDYNTRAPHSALGMRSPVDYRAQHTDTVGENDRNSNIGSNRVGESEQRVSVDRGRQPARVARHPRLSSQTSQRVSRTRKRSSHFASRRFRIEAEVST